MAYKLLKWKIIMMSIICFLGFGLIASPAFTQKPVEIKFGYAPPPGMSPHEAFAEFKRVLEKKSGGQFKVSLFPAAQLGGDRAVMEACQAGNLQMSASSTQNASVFTDAFRPFDLPFIMQTRESAYKVLDGPIGREVTARVEEQTGMKVLIFTEYGGMRQMWNTKKEVRVPADLEGMKIRAVMSPVEMAILKGFGANPVSLDWHEVYTALKQGTIDGQGNSIELMYVAKHYEVQPYCTMLNYIWSAEPAYINARFYNNLSKEKQGMLLEAAHEALIYGRKYAQENEERCLKECKEYGIKFYIPTVEERQEWVNAVAPKIWHQFKNDIGADRIEKVLRAQGILVNFE